MSLFLLLACKKDKLESDDKKLIGTWVCQYTYGGLWGGGTDTDNGRKIEIREKGKYKYCSGSKTLGHGTLVKDNGYYKFNCTKLLSKDDLNGLKILKYHGDTLDIGVAYCCDTYVSVYTKQ